MELRHLRYFAAAAEEVNFGRAAERLRISGPALGQQIKELEGELGVDLFERLPRGVRLTAAGKELLARTNRILKEVQQATEQTQSVGRGDVGVLHVGHVPDSILRSAEVGSRLIPEFCVRYPNIEVTAVQMSDAEQQVALAEGRIDVGVAYFSANRTPHFASEVLDENFTTGAVLPSAHPLSRKPSFYCRDLSALPCLIGNVSPNAFSGTLMDALRARGLEVQLASCQSIDPSVLIGLVSVGAGWFPASAWIVELLGTRNNVMFREWADLPIPSPCCAFWREDDPSALVQKFVAVARELRDAAASGAQGRCGLGRPAARSRRAM